MKENNNNNLILKLPWAGYSLNLIEYFCIIGLEVIEIKNEILHSIITNRETEFDPDVISSVISDTKNMLDNKQIIEVVFPKKITILTSKEPPPVSSHIFSYNPTNYQNSNKKNPFFGTCFLFYERLSNYFKYDEENLKSLVHEKHISNLYVPKAFCIISQYPYFSIYNTINMEIHKMFLSKLEIPVEVMVFSIVNMIPSPINYSIKLNFENKDIFIPQLSGYPVIDFDLYEIFNTLGTNFIVELYILFILDIDMIFFSYNLELLNLAMYVFSILSYPCNDSIHNWFCLSIRIEDFLNPDNFWASRLCPMILGVNERYNNRIETSNIKEASHVIVDLDEKNYFFKKSKKKEKDDLNNFVHFLKNFKQNDNNSNLFKNIKSLISGIDSLNSKSGLKDNFFKKTIKNKINHHVTFLKVDEKICLRNKEIQEQFYKFNLKLYLFFCNFFSMNSNLQIEYKFTSSVKMAPDEIIFSNLFDNSLKFKSFRENYVVFNESSDSYKIPYLFFEEFLHIEKSLQDKFHGYLNIIDEFYSTKAKNIEISMKNIKEYYKINLKNIIFFQKNDEKSISKFLFKSNENYTFEYSISKFDNNIIFTYFYNIKDNIEFFHNIKNNKILSFNYFEIYNHIENNLIKSKVLKTENFIIISLLITFIMTLRGNNKNILNLEIPIFKYLITKNFIFSRKFILLLTEELVTNRSENKNLTYQILRNNLKNLLPYNLLINFILKNEKLNNYCSSPNLLEENSETIINDYSVCLNNNYCDCKIVKNEDYFIKKAENFYTNDNFYVDCAQCKFDKKKLEIIVEYGELHCFNSELFSPLKIFNQASLILNEFMKYDNFYIIKEEIRNKILLNLLFYTKNLKINPNFLLNYLKPL